MYFDSIVLWTTIHQNNKLTLLKTSAQQSLLLYLATIDRPTKVLALTFNRSQYYVYTRFIYLLTSSLAHTVVGPYRQTNIDKIKWNSQCLTSSIFFVYLCIQGHSREAVRGALWMKWLGRSHFMLRVYPVEPSKCQFIVECQYNNTARFSGFVRII